MLNIGLIQLQIQLMEMIEDVIMDIKALSSSQYGLKMEIMHRQL